MPIFQTQGKEMLVTLTSGSWSRDRTSMSTALRSSQLLKKHIQQNRLWLQHRKPSLHMRRRVAKHTPPKHQSAFQQCLSAAHSSNLRVAWATRGISWPHFTALTQHQWAFCNVEPITLTFRATSPHLQALKLDL